MERKLTPTQNANLEHSYAAVGRITMIWAMLESLLDCLVALVYHNLDGRKIDKRLPVSLKRKVSFLRKIFSRSSMLAPYQVEIEPILKQINVLKEKRHSIIHGAIKNAYLDSPENFIMRSLKVSKDMHHLKEIEFGIKESLTFSSEILETANQLLPLVQGIAKKFLGDSAPLP